MVRGLILGVAIGLLAGWLVWDRAPEPESDASREQDLPIRDGTPVQPKYTSDFEEEISRSPALDDAPGLAGPDRSPPAPADERRPDAEVEALLERLGAARRDQNKSTFLALIRLLGDSRHPDAHARLVALTADVDADLPEEFSAAVRPYLEKTDAPGAAAAAIARVEAEFAGRANNEEIYRWVKIAARHGTDAEIQALLSDERIHAGSVYVFLMDRPLDEALRYLEDARGHGIDPSTDGSLRSAFHAFLRAHPAEGEPMLAAGLQALLGGAESWMGGDLRGSLATWLHRIPLEAWPALKRQLAALEGEDRRMAAVEAFRFERRGLDLSGLEELLDQPASSIRKLLATRPPPENAGRRLIHLCFIPIDNRAALTEKNVAAIEYAADTWQGERRSDLAETARSLRTALADKDVKRWR